MEWGKKICCETKKTMIQYHDQKVICPNYLDNMCTILLQFV